MDDWVYAWSVERLLLHRELKVMDYSTSVNVVQTLWGALFCLPAGFSFTALRISTWVAALPCLWSLYLLSRDFHIPRREALFGVATLALNPLFFVLSISFMTDIPFLACITGALFAFARAISTERDRWLWAATLLAALSIGIRVLGAALPIAMALALLQTSRSSRRRRARAVVPLSALLMLAGMLAWHSANTEHIADLSGVANAPQNRLISLRLYAISVLPESLIASLTFIAGALGLALLPLTIASWNRRYLVTTTVTFTTLWLCVALGWLTGWPHYQPLAEPSTWGIAELGLTEPLVPNATQPAYPAWLPWAIASITFASGAFVLNVLVRSPFTMNSVVLAWFALGNFVLLALLWLFFDRYALPFVPVAIVSLLTSGPLRRPRLALAVLLLFGLWSLIGVRDHLHYNAAVWRAAHELRGSGVPAAEIDGGYVVNGWLQYAHPDHAARDKNGNVTVPWINDGGTLPYQISNFRVPGWSVITSVPYTRWLGRSGSIYIIKDESRAN